MKPLLSITDTRYIWLSLLLLFALGTCDTALSQGAVRIRGRVINQEGKLMDAVTVLLLPHAGDKVISSGMSDASGAFELHPKGLLSGDSLRFRVMRVGIRPVTITRATKGLDDVTLKVREERFELKGLSVKADKISEHGDTLRYTVDAYKSVTDHTLADILRKLPGVTVAKNGQILYQGEAISKFYIEGLDMLRGRYGIATNNIHPDDVASIEVMERHQEIEALKELSKGDRAAINIRLKESKKGVWASTSDLSAGIEKGALWDGKLMVSRFAKKHQQLSLFKSNNTDRDLSGELHSFDKSGSSSPSPLASVHPDTPPLSDSRLYRHNKDFSGSLSTILSPALKVTSGTNLIYLHERDEQDNRHTSTHRLPEGKEVIFDEKSLNTSKTDEWAGNLYLNINKPDNYLDTQFTFDVSRRELNSSIRAEKDYDIRHEDAPIALRHNLDWMRGFGKMTLNFKSDNHLTTHPQQLHLSSELQDLKEKSWGTHNDLRLSRHNILPHTSAFVSLFYDHDHASIALRDKKILSSRHQVGISPGIYHSRKQFTLSALMRLGYREDHLRGSATSVLRQPILEPDVHVGYIPNRHVTLELDYRYALQTPDLRSLYNFPIRTDHRTSSVYEGTLFRSSRHLVKGQVNYKHVRAMVFASLTAHYTDSRPGRLFGSRIEGGTILMSSVKSDSRAQGYTVAGRVSKGFFWKSLKIAGEVTLGRVESPLLLQDRVMRIYGDRRSIKADVYLNPIPFVELNAETEFSSFASRIDTGYQQPTIETWESKARLTLKPTERLSAYVDYQHYYNNRNQGDTHFHLLNASTQYRIGKATTLYLRVQNLLDQRTYLFSHVDNFVSYDTVHSLRGRLFLIGIRFKLI